MLKKLGTFIFSVSIGALLLSQSTVSYANDAVKMRKDYLAAEKNIWQANTPTYQNLYQQLHYYPLQPYLDQQRLMHKIRLTDAKEIEEFLAKYQGTPLDWQLRKKWLNYLAKRKRKAMFIRFYTPTSDAELTCTYYNFKLDTGTKAEQILPKVTKLWLTKKSQPKVCDPLFKKWRAAGYLTESVVWQRVELAADGGDHTLLRYLSTLLPQNQQYLALLWKKVRQNPAYIVNLKRFKHRNAKETQILAYGLKRLIWRDQKLALNTYKKAQKNFAFTEQQHQQITQKFALALASKNHDSAYEWLAKVDDQLVDKNITQWRIANALQQNDWQHIKQELASLPEHRQQTQQWRYWQGRALIETGEKERGLQQLTKLAESRHYYGFLAARYLSQEVEFQNQPLTVTEQEKIAVLKHPAAKRAFELFHLGRYNQARREWNYWLSKLTNRDKLVASRIAYEHQWYDRAIFALSRVGYLNDVDLRFPLAYQSEIQKQSGKNKIDPAWAFAIARRESSFMSDANSSVGAKGLMQIMPNTAKQLKRKKVSTKYLLNADNNIALGTKYLRQLLDRYNGNNILATASYNAGPYRVSQWLKEKPSLPADMWIETIPYKETREYVKSVLAYQQIYQHKVGANSTLFDDLHQMTISN